MDFESLNTMCGWERQKAMFLIQIAEQLGMDIDGYGQIGVNNNSGYTYLWLEDYSFTLYMPINCDLKKTDVSALWTNPEDGEEIEFDLKPNTDLDDLEKWANDLYNQIEE
jgi:hypothetical protein